jgi:hypothetical protein
MWLYLLDKPKWWSDSGVFTGVCRKVSPTYKCKILDILFAGVRDERARPLREVTGFQA